ncbi:MAG: hypothetical protein ABUT20_62800, partial [Bacteroidota bacterium]
MMTKHKSVCGILLATAVVIFLFACIDGVQKASIQQTKNDWEEIGPGGGGATFIPAFSYHNPAKFLIRCDMTGSYITDDGGQSYRQINFPNGASSFAFDPGDSSVIYIGSAFLNKSTDGGKTWTKVFPRESEIVSEKYFGDHGNYHIETTQGSLYDSNIGEITNIRVDPVSSMSLYFSMGKFFFYSNDNGITWNKIECNSSIQFIYVNNENLKNNVFIFTGDALSVFDKTTKSIVENKFPVALQPAFSFTGGLTKNKQTVFYALHNDSDENKSDEFGHSTVWISTDNGLQWREISDLFVNNSAVGIKPSYSMIACSEFNAEQAYLIANRYEQKKDAGMIYWYGAMKTKDAGKQWKWVWKGGGGSGQYGVKDGKGVTNLNDAWAEKAFGGEYIR